MKKARIGYAMAFCVLLFIEIFIGLFIRDNFIRPYVGDVLVTVLIGCLCRTVIPKGVPALPIYVFAFATLVEVAQYFRIIEILGLENTPLISTIVGTTFSFVDILCYGFGCLAFRGIEKAAASFSRRRHPENS